ncbi:hypothetical protein OY671_007725, partial [Metschnikowia pulcherrima]
APDHDGILAGVSGSPFVAPPGVGEAIDGFRIARILSEGRHAVSLVATDGEDGEQVVLKFPRREISSDHARRSAFARESSLSRRVASPFVSAARAVRPERRSGLYSVSPSSAGESMEARSARGLPPLEEGRQAAIGSVRGLAASHKLEVVHRDVKPDNVMSTSDGGVKSIDLGVARLPRVEDFHPDEIPGTPGFMAPEQFDGNAGDASTDQFASGVTLYRWFTGKWPYGEQEAFQRPRFGVAPAPSRYRPEIPSWLDAAILAAIAPRRDDRFGDVVDSLRAPESGGVSGLAAARRRPSIERDPVSFWKGASASSAAASVASSSSR